MRQKDTSKDYEVAQSLKRGLVARKIIEKSKFEHEGTGGVTKSQDDGDEQNSDAQRQLIENPLHKFATVNPRDYV